MSQRRVDLLVVHGFRGQRAMNKKLAQVCGNRARHRRAIASGRPSISTDIKVDSSSTFGMSWCRNLDDSV